MGITFCKNSFIGELFWHFRIYGYDFQKVFQIYGYSFEKFLRIFGYASENFLRIYGWYFYDLNGTTPYLGNSSYPPPPGSTCYFTFTFQTFLSIIHFIEYGEA